MKQQRAYSWKMASGKTMKAEISYEIKVSEKVIDLDGDKFATGEMQVFEFGEIEFYLDGKKVDSARFKKGSLTSEYYDRFIREVTLRNGAKAYAICGSKVAASKETAEELKNIVSELIASVENESEEAKKVEIEKTAVELKKADEKVATIEKQDKLPTRAELKAIQERESRIYNDGGDGYVTTCYTVEDLEDAKAKSEKLKKRLNDLRK